MMTPITSLVLLATAGLPAQSSSLFLRSQGEMQGRAAATTQPMAPDGTVLATAGAATPADADANLELRMHSMIAVVPAEPKHFRVNDQVNIVVRHRISYRADGRVEQNRTQQFDAKLSDWFRFHDDRWIQQDFQRGTPQVKFDLTDNRRGQGRNQRQDELTTRIQAVVIDVKPNGTLVIEARAEYQYEEETQSITLTGSCRSEDISPDNSILSDKIAGLTVRTENKGVVRDTTKRGFLPRAFDKVKPF